MQSLQNLHSGEKNILFMLALLVLLLMSFTRASASATYTLENGMIKLTSSAYEVALNADSGAINYILDKSSGENISDGSAGGSLWAATLTNHQTVTSADADQFTYQWDSATSTLTLTYSGTLGVAVTLSAGDQALTMQASISNHSGDAVSDFQFPNQLAFAASDITDALMPMMPGALISPAFFTQGNIYINEYPGVMFADYLALRSAHGKLAVYTQRGERIQPALIGFAPLPDSPDTTTLVHSYHTWIEDAKSWDSPSVVVSVGQDYPASIESYRTDNGIDQYPSLADKLGSDALAYFAAPMYKLDLAALRLTFNDLQSAVVAKINIPGIVHLVAFQPRGHDKNYPDFLPPDPKWGTTEDFAALVSAIHDSGSLAVPYTNFSWWDINSPTLKQLPADTPAINLADVKDSHGMPGFETYGPNSGFVMNLHNTFVADRIAQEHTALLDTVGMDAIFEDQWGARNAPYDYNPAGLETNDPSTSYFEGVLDHYRTQANSRIMTEVGVDVLAENGVAFMGTNYLWDMLGYRSATASVTTYYPMAAMLFRDKVLLYQHDLAAETWTSSKNMLRWNLAQGYSLSNAFLDNNLPGLNMDNSWLNVIGVFQKYALANYVDQRVVSYDNLDNNVTRTAFSTYTVSANWDESSAFTVAGDTLPADGVITQANDGSVTAGVFTAYNDQPLSDGDHYLVEVRAPDAISVFQPLGADTELHINALPNWTSVAVTAYHYDGTPIATIDASLEGSVIAFTYASALNGEQVGYYRISPAV